jgi:hypothetical protein
MATVAFVEKELGLEPCHPSKVRKGDTFYLVVDGKQQPVCKALNDATPVGSRLDPHWHIESEEVQ